MSKKIKAAIIGAGDIGFRYTLDPLRCWPSSHLQAYKEHSDFKPVAVCDIDKNKLKKAKSYQPSINIYTFWQQMLREEQIDILSVCVSPALNLMVSRSDLLKNIKAIILEKPFAYDINTGKEIIRALKSKNIIAAVNYFRRWQKTFWIVKELIESNKIGKILKVNAYYPAGIWTGATHMIDILHYLLGDFTQVRALERYNIPEISDYLYTAFGYIGKIPVYLCGFQKNNFNIFEIEVWGKKGRIIVSDFGEKIILQQANPSKRFSRQKELFITKYITVAKYNSYFLNLLENISAALSSREKLILCMPEDAIKVTAVVRAIEESYKYGKEISITGR